MSTFKQTTTHMTILQQIIAYKHQEVADRKAIRPIAALEQMPHFARQVPSLKRSVMDPSNTGIIAEFKRRSPSKGIINDVATVQEVTAAYTAHGASGISVLTDGPSFGGSLNDLLEATANHIPLLRKDFMIDEYQLVEAKAHGAAVILLIAACLTPQQVKRLAATAKGLGLEVLLELHGRQELDHVCDDVDLIGINNRNLDTFQVNWQHSIDMAAALPTDRPKIAESGIHDIDTLLMLQRHGFHGFLIGEMFMKRPDPTTAFASFVNQLRSARNAGGAQPSDT